MLGVTETLAIDVSDFEGADTVHDLNRPVSPELEASCGLLVDGSLLDNIFDPTTALKKIARRLLEPGGRCFVHNMGSTSADFAGIPYTMFTPLWFFDYFVWNEFEYCQVYIYTPHEQGVDIYAISYEHAGRFVGDGFIKPIVSDYEIYMTVYAEKGLRSTWDNMPTQHAYRNEEDWARYSRIIEGYLDQKRPYLVLGGPGPIRKGVPYGYVRAAVDQSTRAAEAVPLES